MPITRWVSFDCETFLIGPGCLAPPLVCGSFYVYAERAGQSEHVLVPPSSTCSRMREYLEDRETLIIGHNVAFDLAVIAAADPSLLLLTFDAYEQNRISDTQIRELLLRNARGRLKGGAYSLAALETQYLRLDRSAQKKAKAGQPDPWRLRYRELRTTPIDQWPEEATRYALDDSKNTYLVWKQQPDSAVPGGLDDSDPVYPFVVDEFRQARAHWALHLMGVWGVRADETLAAKARVGYEAKFHAARAKAVAQSVIRPDGTKDTKIIQERLAAMGVDVRTPTGRLSMTEEVLSKVPDDALRGLAESSTFEKYLSTYIRPVGKNPGVPINGRINVLMETGRTSMSDPNLQNVPKEGGIREMYVPRPGYCYISTDYDTLELRALAQVHLEWFGHSTMADLINSGKDLHVAFACQLLGVSYEQGMAMRKAKHPDMKTARDFAKVANFGFPGGLGADTFVEYAAQFGVFLQGRDQAKALKDKWLATFPEMRKYFKVVADNANNLDNAFTAVQLYSGRLRGSTGYTQGCNTFFQGLAADGAKNALFQLARACYTGRESVVYGCRPVLFIHDEIIMEAPVDGDLDAVSKEMERIMCDAMAEFIPRVKITASASVMDRWTKEVDETRDGNGRLRPTPVRLPDYA